MAEQLANNAASTLSAAITTVGATSCTVANGTVFPATGNFRILIDSELILVGARSGNTLSSLTRGIESTTAATHLNAAPVTHVLTKGGLDQYMLEAVQPSARAKRTSVQTVTTVTWTLVTFNGEDWDSDVIHDNSTNPARLTCKTAGKYLYAATINWFSNTTGLRAFQVQKNSEALPGTGIGGQVTVAPATGITLVHSAVGMVDLAVNDYLAIVSYQNSGGNLDILADSNFEMIRLLA